MRQFVKEALTNVPIRLMLLELIASNSGGYVRGKTRLQKQMFLLQKKLCDEGKSDIHLYPYFRWNYGPYSSELEDDLQWLEVMGLVEEDSVQPINVRLTSGGKEMLEGALKEAKLSAELIDSVRSLARDYQFTSLSELLTKVYDLIHLEERYEMGEEILSDTTLIKT